MPARGVIHTVGPNYRAGQTDRSLLVSCYRRSLDDELLVNTHVMGSPAPHNPVIHVRRLEGGRLFNHYLSSFDRVWESANPSSPVEPDRGAS